MAPRNRYRRAFLGAILALAGLSTLCALFVITNCLSDGCQTAMFNLGLAGMALVSCLAQIGLFVGAWMVLTSWRRRDLG